MARTKPNGRSKKKQYSFAARLEEAMYGNFTYAAAFLPKKILEIIPSGRLRTKGTLNDIPFSLAIQYRKDGRSFFLFSRSVCKKAGVHVGDSVVVSFLLVDRNIVELPEELEIVLAQDEHAKKVWDNFSVGLRRSLALYVSPVKSVDGRIKRALEMANKMKAGLLHSQLVRKNKKL